MFDTLTAARMLAAAGIDTKHADAIATAVRQAAEHGGYVTPEMLDATLATQRTDVGHDLNGLPWRLISAGIAIAGLTVAVLRLLGWHPRVAQADVGAALPFGTAGQSADP